ncbi:MAG: PAC2 family protein [Acidimicrobiia bacterium]
MPELERIRWVHRPPARARAAVVAFAGWGDAGESSTGAIDHLLDTLAVDPVAVIEPDEFYDFTVRRPQVEIVGGGQRQVVWPDTRVSLLAVPGESRELVIVRGEEPHARWKTFSAALVDVFEALGVEEVVSLGAFIGQVPHTVPVPLVGSGQQASVLTRHGLLASGYEGPTGIIGVLNQTLLERGVAGLSLWAAVPHYLSSQAYPPGALALVEKALAILDIPIECPVLRIEAAEFRATVDAAVADSEELSGYVEELEQELDPDLVRPAPDSGIRLVEEIERFLRDR